MITMTRLQRQARLKKNIFALLGYIWLYGSDTVVSWCVPFPHKGFYHPRLDNFLPFPLLKFSKSGLRVLELPQDSIPFYLRSQCDRATILLNTMQEPLTKASLG